MADGNATWLKTFWNLTIRSSAPSLGTPRIAATWLRSGASAEDAAAWANLGYLPEEAAGLIAQGITPVMAAAAEDAAVDADGGPDEHLRAAVLRLTEDHNLIIDPDLADRFGLD